MKKLKEFLFCTKCGTGSRWQFKDNVGNKENAHWKWADDKKPQKKLHLTSDYSCNVKV